MKQRFRLIWLILTAIMFLFSVVICRAEGDSGIILQEKEWTWEKNNIASFEGTVQFKNLPAGKLLLKLSLTTEPKATNPGEVVFQTVNGKKLTLKKQKNEYVFNHEDQDTLDFIGNWRTPNDIFFTKIDVSFQICTEDGESVLAEQKMTVSRTDSEMDESEDGKIRLKADLAEWTLWIGITAGVIWILAIVRILLNRTRCRPKDGSQSEFGDNSL